MLDFDSCFVFDPVICHRCFAPSVGNLPSASSAFQLAVDMCSAVGAMHLLVLVLFLVRFDDPPTRSKQRRLPLALRASGARRPFERYPAQSRIKIVQRRDYAPGACFFRKIAALTRSIRVDLFRG